MDLKFLLNQCLVFDIETYAEYEDGREINIQSNFEDYIHYAQCKFIGLYSYKYNKEYYFEVSKDFDIIKDIISEHNILIGFNSEDFDFPILLNNNLINPYQKFIHVDCMKILGSATFKDKRGFKYKGRGELMGFKFKRNSLKCIAETMNLTYQKSNIDYKIFKKDLYTEQELKDIYLYLKNDVLATKGMFDKLWEYWLPFTSMLRYEYIINLSWLKSSIASLIYKSACNVLNTEPTYCESPKKTEEMGGRVIKPKYEEAKNVWYIDFGSMYPHIFCMFNLFAEIDKDYPVQKWHGNDLFEVKGYYDVSYKHPLALEVEKKLKQRIELKKSDPTNPLTYTLKIFLNGLYGVIRSSVFEKVHTPNAGWDCCWLGQQIQIYTEKRLKEFGFESIYGDTDSLMITTLNEKINNEQFVKECLKKIVSEILSNVPFPVETYNINLENFLPYVLFAFSEQPIIDEITGKNKKIKNRLVKERTGNKKNYLYLYEKEKNLDIKLVGLPIIKDNATPLGMKIYKEVLKPRILDAKRAKFTKEFIDNQINEYLKNKDVIESLATEYKVKPLKTYKTESQIQAQISKNYFNGADGVIHLIKNNKIGKVGLGTKYCTIEEALENKLSVNDLDLDKVYKELEVFILVEEPALTNIEK